MEGTEYTAGKGCRGYEARLGNRGYERNDAHLRMCPPPLQCKPKRGKDAASGWGEYVVGAKLRVRPYSWRGSLRNPALSKVGDLDIA